MHPLAVQFDPTTRRPALIARVALVAAFALAAVAAPAAVHAQKGQASPAAAPTAGGGAIQGYVYFDADGDGAFGPRESAVAGVPIRLLGPEGADTAATDNRGFYQYTGLGAGSYAVAIDATALAVLLGSADGLDVPGYDALNVAGETLTGVNFALDQAQVARLAEALAKAVAAVQAALPNGLPSGLPDATAALTEAMAAAGDAMTETTAADASVAVTSTDAATTTESMTTTTAVTATTATSATMRPSTKGGRQAGGASGAMTTTASAEDAVTTTAVAATSDAVSGVAAAAETTSGGPAAMPGGGLADVFGPGSLAAIASLLGLLGGIGATRRRRSPTQR